MPEAKQIVERYGITQPFVLYVSRIEHPGKNHCRLVAAMERLRKVQMARGDEPHQLVLVGSRWNGAEAVDAEIAKLQMGDAVVFPGFVEDEDLPSFYAAADLFVFPSLFEGFGIPPLEAMAAGTPVCASNQGSIPEVVGAAAALFDPYDVDAIARSMDDVLADESRRRDMRQAGYAQIQRFSWSAAGAAVLRLCHEVAR